MSSFENLRIVDNFYQTSLFFPMPTVLISTLCEDGSTNLGPYSLIQPYYVAGKDYYAMLLNCRNSSNTAQNILRTGKCAINFIDDNPKTFHGLAISHPKRCQNVISNWKRALFRRKIQRICAQWS